MPTFGPPCSQWSSFTRHLVFNFTHCFNHRLLKINYVFVIFNATSCYKKCFVPKRCDTIQILLARIWFKKTLYKNFFSWLHPQPKQSVFFSSFIFQVLYTTSQWFWPNRNQSLSIGAFDVNDINQFTCLIKQSATCWLREITTVL